MRKVLKENNPVYQKVQKVFDLMDELGISFIPHTTYIEVVSHPDLSNKRYELLDLEDEMGCIVSCLPPPCEWKIVYKKE